MCRLVDCSRKVLLGTAFVLVMAGSGGFFGAIVGVMLVLLSHTVLGTSAGMAELMPLSIGLGILTAMSFGVFLAARQVMHVSWQPGLISIKNPESEHVS